LALRFTHVRLENWRNFQNANVELDRRVFLFGPNASGKSNFLDAFRFLRDIVSMGGGFQQAISIRGGVSKIRCLAARRYPAVVIEVGVGNSDGQEDWKYELQFVQDNRQRPVIEKEVVRKNGKVVLARPVADDQGDPEQLRQTHLEQIRVNKEFRELASFLQSVDYLHIVPQLVRDPDRYRGQANDPFGWDFLDKINKTPEKTRNARLKRIRDALRVAVPQLLEFELMPDARGVPHLRGRYDHWRHHGAWQTEEAFSDGTLRLLGLLWAILEGSGPLLLEEPELSLHPGVVQYIPQLLARMQRRTGRQVIVSSHSSDLLLDEGIGLNEVLLLEPAPGGTSVTPVSSIRDIQELLRGGLTLADAVIPRTRPRDAQQLSFVFGDE
jgi:predicted ATPase